MIINYIKIGSLRETIIKGVSVVDYEVGDILKNKDDFYFEVTAVEIDFAKAEQAYYLNNIGYYNKLGKLKTSKLENFDRNLTYVIDKEEKKKIRRETNFI